MPLQKGLLTVYRLNQQRELAIVAKSDPSLIQGRPQGRLQSQAVLLLREFLTQIQYLPRAIQEQRSARLWDPPRHHDDVLKKSAAWVSRNFLLLPKPILSTHPKRDNQSFPIRRQLTAY